MSRLAAFIREHTEEILAEWDSFAHSLPQAQTMDFDALRDHAREMLGVIVHDLEAPQTGAEQLAKSKGLADADDSGAQATAAQEHGAARALSDFTISQMLSELRALRASVIKLWTKERSQLTTDDVQDVIRFNEAIDQTLAESVAQFTAAVGHANDRFLAILGHDLRNPLGAIMMSAGFLLETGDAADPKRPMLERIARSARRMNQMVEDILDFTRTRFGGGIPITRSDMDLAKLVHDVAAEVGSRYPASPINVDTSGELRGEWDCSRLSQALTNLVTNAVEHGLANSPVTISARGAPDEVTVSVHNQGPVIAEDIMPRIFTEGVRGAGESPTGDSHLGLGLFIVDKIVSAHGGRIDVTSSEEAGTMFTVHLPRAAAGGAGS